MNFYIEKKVDGEFYEVGSGFFSSVGSGSTASFAALLRGMSGIRLKVGSGFSRGLDPAFLEGWIRVHSTVCSLPPVYVGRKTEGNHITTVSCSFQGAQTGSLSGGGGSKK